MGWLILALYVVGYIFVVRKVYWALLNDGLETDGTDKAIVTSASLLVSTVWFLLAVGYGFWFLFLRGVKTDREIATEAAARREAERKELEKLRRLAKEYNLPGSENL